MTPTYGHELRHDRAIIERSLEGASSTPFWLDDPSRPAPRPELDGDRECDLLVVGGGFCGLWTALVAAERDPGRRIVLVEGKRIAWSASGRNGGFCEASLTHGEDNGQARFADELPIIERLARENFDEIARAIERHGIDAEWEHSGELIVATEEHQVEGIEEAARLAAAHDPDARYLTGEALREYADSPVYLAGAYTRAGAGFVHPAKLAWGLAAAAERLGVEIVERTPVRRLRTEGAGAVVAETEHGTITARRVALATNAFPSLVPHLRLFTVPIYDYAIMTEPLTPEQLASIGWTGRHGIGDSSHEFHYSRKTADDRILYGGFDAVYHRGGRIRPEHDQRRETFERLADHLLTTFPQLEGVRCTHAWGGAIDMSTQLVAFHGLAKDGRVAYSAGYTGLGVAATRFGAETMLDLLDGHDTDRTRLSWARRLPTPIPPEPAAYPIIQTMRKAVQRADRTGREGLLLRLARLFGVSFDS